MGQTEGRMISCWERTRRGGKVAFSLQARNLVGEESPKQGSHLLSLEEPALVASPGPAWSNRDGAVLSRPSGFMAALTHPEELHCFWPDAIEVLTCSCLLPSASV